MRTPLSRRIALASAAAVLAVSSLGVATASAGLGGGYANTDDFGAACSASVGSRTTLTATFTIEAAEAGNYYYAFRTDPAEGTAMVIATRTRYLSAGEKSFSASTRLSGPYVFGIYNILTQAYDYVSCSQP